MDWSQRPPNMAVAKTRFKKPERFCGVIVYQIRSETNEDMCDIITANFASVKISNMKRHHFEHLL